MKKIYLEPEIKVILLKLKTNVMFNASGDTTATEKIDDADVLESGEFD